MGSSAVNCHWRGAQASKADASLHSDSVFGVHLHDNNEMRAAAPREGTCKKGTEHLAINVCLLLYEYGGYQIL